MRQYFFLLAIIFFCGIHSCTRDNTTPPWTNLTWLNPHSSEIKITNSKNKNDSIKISHFSKTMRKTIEYNITLRAKENKIVSIELFRPELIDIEYQDTSQHLYLIPRKILEIVLNDSSLTPSGHNEDIYNILINIGDHSIEKLDFQNIIQESRCPKWLSIFLRKSRKLKESYKIYHQASYQQFIGMTDVLISEEDSLKAEALLSGEDSGIYQNYYTLLNTFKSNFDFMNRNKSLAIELENYAKRKNLFDNISNIKNEQLRYNMLALHIEGNIIRKRKSFKDKDKITSYVIGMLPNEYALKLNEIEKEYTEYNYNQKDILQILQRDITSLIGKERPLKKNKEGFTLLKFWFSGCAPCKKQIPFDNMLINNHKNLTINHFCYSTEINIWKNYISENNVLGKHFYLNSEDYKDYKKVFSLGYAPRYILLNEKNEIVCWECANPSNKEFDALIH